MAAEDEDFDVEGWNRRLADTPSGPIGPPRVRTRHLDRPRHPSELPPDDELGPFAWAPDDSDAETDAETEAFGRGAAHSRGWRRGVALMLLGLLLLPLLIEAVQLASRILS